MTVRAHALSFPALITRAYSLDPRKLWLGLGTELCAVAFAVALSPRRFASVTHESQTRSLQTYILEQAWEAYDEYHRQPATEQADPE
jgi:hypothetical protein